MTGRCKVDSDAIVTGAEEATFAAGVVHPVEAWYLDHRWQATVATRPFGVRNHGANRWPGVTTNLIPCDRCVSFAAWQLGSSGMQEVIATSVATVVVLPHGPDDRESIGTGGQPGQVFTKLNAREAGLARPVFTADRVGCIWFRIESFVL
jgi:hypothetical protein